MSCAYFSKSTLVLSVDISCSAVTVRCLPSLVVFLFCANVSMVVPPLGRIFSHNDAKIFQPLDGSGMEDGMTDDVRFA